MNNPIPEPSEAYHWTLYLERSGAAAEAWLQRYRETSCQELLGLAQRALTSLRYDLGDDSLHLLESMRRALGEDSLEPAIAGVLERHLYGVRAYYHYRVQDYAAADGDLLAADAAVRTAIDRGPFLVPFALHCHELRLQRARIARNRLAWDEVAGHLQAVREMLRGSRPLCVLASGESVSLPDIRDFYDRLSLDPQERLPLEYLVHDSVRLELLERSLEKIYALPWQVIPLT